MAQLFDLPGNQSHEEDVDWQTESPVEHGWRVPWFLLSLAFKLRIRGAATSALVIVGGNASSLLDVMLSMVVMWHVRRVRILVEQLASLLVGGASGVRDMRALLMDSASTVVDMLMSVLQSRVECRVWVRLYMCHWRSVVVGHGEWTRGQILEKVEMNEQLLPWKFGHGGEYIFAR